MVWERLGSASVGVATAATSWKELGRTTLGSSGSSIDVTSLSGKQNLMILADVRDMDNIHLTFNNDTGNNYAYRESVNGGSDSTSTSQAKIELEAQSQQKQFAVSNVINISGQEKLLLSHTASNNNGGASNIPVRAETVGKWANTSAQITSVKLSRTGSNDFTSGSEVVVLGYDDDESDSGTNFWQELASVELTSGATSIDTGTFTAKKYLMFQLNANNTANLYPYMRFNGTTGNEYAYRKQANGTADSTNASQPQISVYASDKNDSLVTGYILNNTKERLAIIESISAFTAGAANAPQRYETVGKWANTSNAITSLKIFGGNGSEQFLSGTTLKVWGSD